jgi:hypothetical protein
MAIDLQHATQGADQLYHLYRGHIGGRQLDRQALQVFLDRMVNLAAGRHTFVQGGGEVTSLDDLADLINQLHDEDRLVIGSTDNDAIKIVCSLGVQD